MDESRDEREPTAKLPPRPDPRPERPIDEPLEREREGVDEPPEM